MSQLKIDMGKLLRKRKNISKKEWRCPVCKRLFGVIRDDNFLEIKTSNRQVIIIDPKVRIGKCKCGTIIKVE